MTKREKRLCGGGSSAGSSGNLPQPPKEFDRPDRDYRPLFGAGARPLGTWEEGNYYSLVSSDPMAGRSRLVRRWVFFL